MVKVSWLPSQITSPLPPSPRYRAPPPPLSSVAQKLNLGQEGRAGARLSSEPAAAASIPSFADARRSWRMRLGPWGKVSPLDSGPRTGGAAWLGKLALERGLLGLGPQASAAGRDLKGASVQKPHTNGSSRTREAVRAHFSWGPGEASEPLSRWAYGPLPPPLPPQEACPRGRSQRARSASTA